MCRYLSSNPYRDYDRWEANQEAWLRSRPKCDCCGEPIQEDFAYRINEELYCKDCIDDAKVRID